MTPWTYLRISARWEIARLRRCWRGEAAESPRALAEPMPEPERPRCECSEADREEPAPAFTLAERRRLDYLADWWWSASPGTREAGADLADWLRGELPDVPPLVAARVLLAAGRHMERAANAAEDERGALQGIADAMFGAPTVLAGAAELDAELTELAEGRPWA